ncbi:Uncharacterised protein [Vibrio cholerae]|nr:Uncharacterised protein [Vibrio cholerae]
MTTNSTFATLLVSDVASAAILTGLPRPTVWPDVGEVSETTRS